MFDLAMLAESSGGSSGAEIEQASAKVQLTTEILVTEIQSAQPLSVTRAEEVQAIREWAKKRAVAAD